MKLFPGRSLMDTGFGPSKSLPAEGTYRMVPGLSLANESDSRPMPIGASGASTGRGFMAWRARVQRTRGPGHASSRSVHTRSGRASGSRFAGSCSRMGRAFSSSTSRGGFRSIPHGLTPSRASYFLDGPLARNRRLGLGELQSHCRRRLPTPMVAVGGVSRRRWTAQTGANRRRESPPTGVGGRRHLLRGAGRTRALRRRPV